MPETECESNTSKLGVVSGVFETFDPEEMLEVVPKTQLEHTQLTPGRFKGEWLQAGLGESLLASGTYNLPIGAQGSFPEDRICIGYLMQVTGTSHLNGQPFGVHSLPVWAEGSECHIDLGANADWGLFEIEREKLESLGVSVEKEVCRIHTLSPQAQQRIKLVFNDAVHLLSQIQYQQPSQNNYARMVGALQDTITSTLSSELIALQTSSKRIGTSSGYSRYKLVSQAERLVESHTESPVHVTQLCEQLRTSVRRLELAFQDIHGMSPREFLTMRKFTLVRKELLNSSPDKCSVTEIAMRHGFFHMGRFSVNYKHIFGESPSTTLYKNAYRRLAYIQDMLNKIDQKTVAV